mgnify:CR=1 FL=1
MKNWLIRVTVNQCKMLFRSPWRKVEDIGDMRKRNFPQAPFERYADDGMIHCRTREEELSKFDFLARENAKRYNIHINDMKGGGQHERR